MGFCFNSVCACVCNGCCAFRVVQGREKILGEVNQRSCGFVMIQSLIPMMIREVHCLPRLLILRIVTEVEGPGLSH